MKKIAVVRACKVLCFLALALMLLLNVQRVLGKKWIYPSFIDNTIYGLNEFYELSDEIDMQAVFLGTSHTLFGVDPMAIYERNGVVTYNLGTTSQPMEGSLFFLSEVLEHQNPSAVFLDVGNLFRDEAYFNNNYNFPYRAILDNTPLSRHKIELAETYAAHSPQEKRIGSFLGAFVPIYQYHDRWSELSQVDFEQTKGGNYFLKGFALLSNVKPLFDGIGNPDWMNRAAEQLHGVDRWVDIFANGEFNHIVREGSLYEPTVNDTALEYLKRMKEMCEDKGVKFILLKVPSVNHINNSGWTELRSEATKKLASELHLDFLDLLYDVDLGLDWSMDTIDGGMHLNYAGAAKVSAFLADYLEHECGLVGAPCKAYDEDLPIYRTLCAAAELEMINALPTYLDKLAGREDITVFLSVSDDMMENLSRESKDALKRLGLHTDFDTLHYQDSFLAVIEGGEVLVEQSSNRNIAHQDVLSNGQSFLISSSGWVSVPESIIRIDGINHSLGQRGLNIVVLDNESGLVLDSVAFDTSGKKSDACGSRNNAKTNGYLMEYELYLMTRDAENGIGI